MGLESDERIEQEVEWLYPAENVGVISSGIRLCIDHVSAHQFLSQVYDRQRAQRGAYAVFPNCVYRVFGWLVSSPIRVSEIVSRSHGAGFIAFRWWGRYWKYHDLFPDGS